MPPALDVIVVGLGAMGSAIARELASRGRRVLGLDRYASPHALGSSHGESRIIREAYFEHPVYVPMVQRAYVLWRKLEQESGSVLLRETGGLMIGRPDSVLVSGARRSAEIHRLSHRLLSAAEIRESFPALHPEADMVAVWEPRAGILFPEACIDAQLAQARRHGADLRMSEGVVDWHDDGDSVRVMTATGEYRARQIVIAAGAWVRSLLPDVEFPVRIERQTLHWFDCTAAAEIYAPDRCPIHLWQFDGRRFFYGFPDLGNGAKLGFHHEGESTTTETVRREVALADIEEIRAAVQRFTPEADGPPRRSTVCLYTNTADEHFRIDRHPTQRQVLVVSPCSGHGFKFAPVIGEIVADLVDERAPRFDLELFRWR